MDIKFLKPDLILYKNAARKYLPEEIKFLLIAESPPTYKDTSKMSYFYFEDNPGNDMFFQTVVKAFFNIDYLKNYKEKIKLLSMLKKEGLFLMDSVEYPINRDIEYDKVSDSIRKGVILKELPDFYSRFIKLNKNGNINGKTKLILVKRIVCETLIENLISNKVIIYNINSPICQIGFPKYPKADNFVRPFKVFLNL